MLRTGEHRDISRILEIYEEAKRYMNREGIPQWTKDYPNRDTVVQDIANNVLYVWTQEEAVLGVSAFIPGRDPTYAVIEGGVWCLQTEAYGTIHRMAVAGDAKGKGISGKMLAALETLCKERSIPSIRVDTHKKNSSMRRWIEKSGFTYCGVITVADGTKRVAYEKKM